MDVNLSRVILYRELKEPFTLYIHIYIFCSCFIRVLFAQLYIKYSYLIQLICTQLYGFKYSNLISIFYKQLYAAN